MGRTLFRLLPQLPTQFQLQREPSVSEHKSAGRSLPGVPPAAPAPLAGRDLPPGPSPEPAPSEFPVFPLPSPRPAASPMRTRRCFSRVSGSLRVSSTFCVDFRTSPCGFLENIPPGPAPAPSSRGRQRPADLPALGSLHSQRRRHRLLLLLRAGTAMRSGRRARRGANSPRAGGRAAPALPLLPPSLSSRCFTTAVKCDPRRPHGNRVATSGRRCRRPSEARRAGPGLRWPGPGPSMEGGGWSRSVRRSLRDPLLLGNSYCCARLYLCCL